MAFTKITHAGIGSTGTVLLENLEVTGVGTFGGSVSVGGTLTYEDVTNIDSVGIITARAGVLVGSGITLSKDGDGFFTGIVTATSYYGDGSNLSNITSTTINNNADNRLITGSGTANTLNGESTITYDGTNLDLGDDKKIRVGASQDLEIYHSSSNAASYIQNSTGNLFIEAPASNAVILRKKGTTEVLLKASSDGAVELYYDNSSKLQTTSSGIELLGGLFLNNPTNAGKDINWDITNNHFEFYDSVAATFGTGNDLQIYHNGSTNIIDAATSNAISFRYGGNEQFFIGSSEFKGADNKKIKLGTGDDMQLYHDGTTNYIECGASNFAIRVNSGNRIEVNGSSGDVTMQGSGGKNFLWDNSTAYLNLNDNARLTLGTGNDMHLYHDGTSSIIQSASHAIAYYSNTRHHFLNADGSANVAVLSPQGQCDFYSNGTLKLEVEDNGIQVHNGGIDLNRQAQPYSAAIYFAGFGDTNHMLWHDYYDNPNGTRSNASGFDGIKWNVYAGLRLYKGNESETIAQFNGDGACELWFDNVKQINTHPNGIFTRGIYPMSDNSFDIGASSQRFKRVYATNGSIQTSDRTEKNTIIESDLGLDFVNKLKPVSYKWNEDDGKTHYGLIAQDVEETLIDIGKTVSDSGVVSKEDDSPMGLSYNEFISPLIKAVQELTAKNDALEARIKTLEG